MVRTAGQNERKQTTASRGGVAKSQGQPPKDSSKLAGKKSPLTYGQKARQNPKMKSNSELRIHPNNSILGAILSYMVSAWVTSSLDQKTHKLTKAARVSKLLGQKSCRSSCGVPYRFCWLRQQECI